MHRVSEISVAQFAYLEAGSSSGTGEGVQESLAYICR